MYCRYRGSRRNVLWASKVIWRMERIGMTWGCRVYRVSWPSSLVMILTDCLLTALYNSTVNGVLKSRQGGSKRFCHIFAFTRMFVIGSFYIVFIIFLERGCLHTGGRLFYFYFSFLSFHIWPKGFDVKWIRNESSLNQSITQRIMED